MSEFDQVLEEDNRTNRIEESHLLLKALLQDTFRETPTILFLNKIDILKNKIREGADPTKNFPGLAKFVVKGQKKPVSFEGTPLNEGQVEERYNVTMAYFEKMFKKEHPDKNSVYVHHTCATDTENIRVVELRVRETIIKDILRGAGVN